MTFQMIKRVGVMLDIETLGKGANAVVTQVAMLAFDEDDPETVIREIEEYLPIQPQLTLGRTIDADTMLWWMKQSDAARGRFSRNEGDDFAELTALVTSVSRKLEEISSETEDFTLYARGPQFDVVILESLMQNCGLTTPWRYDAVSDLRTIMKEARLHSKDVPVRAGLVPHHALSDCRIQIDQLLSARRALRSAT